MRVSPPSLVAYYSRYFEKTAATVRINMGNANFRGYLFSNYWTVSGIAIKKSPNCEKKIFAVFRKTSKSIAHEISKFSRKTL
ncbi:hypothetical protein T10_7944 [Trichinella papuae]|uniref:Uncharacterized protein n=1 Tax=Trichinella papuae TaxID=268474 RepID=A0A0V1LYY7_9BILA|nr:hypothetical protein T10_7944 [Trichinella papuae]